MRIDKYLKVSRIIKRRTVAKELCDSNRVYVNDKIVSASYTVKLDDVIKIIFGRKELIVKVLQILENAKISDAYTMYEVLEERFKENENEIN